MAASYQNFDIRVLPKGTPRQYQLLIVYPGVQPETGHVIDCELPPSYAELLRAAAPDRQRRWRKSTADLLNEQNLACHAADLEAVKEIGDRLFQTVLQGELAGEYGVVADRVAREGGLLRLRINLTKAPELSSEPWEALYRKRSEVLLAIHAATPIVRLLDSPTPPDTAPVSPPVRLLVVTAVPGHDLDVGKELGNIRRRTERLVAGNRAVPFSTQVLEGATRATLAEAIREFRPHFLHYIGHGSFERGSGWIHLHDKDDPRDVDHIDAETLRDMLANDRPKLVVLNTCEGGMASDIDPFSGMAHALIQRNIPYVVAMQYPISDEAAIAFSDVLYADLANGKPIDVAVTNARNAIRLLANPEAQVELITPVLYTSGSIDRLIEQTATEPAAEESPPAAARSPRARSLWIIGGVGGIAAIALLFGTFVMLGDQLGTKMAPDVQFESPGPPADQNAMAEVEIPEDELTVPPLPLDDDVAEENELFSSVGDSEPPSRPTRPRRARRPAVAPQMPGSILEPVIGPPEPDDAPSSPPPPPPPPPPPYPATEGEAESEYRLDPNVLEVLSQIIAGSAYLMSDSPADGNVGQPGGAPGSSGASPVTVLMASAIVTVSAAQIADSAQMARLRELPAFRAVTTDPDLVVNVAGRGGGTYQLRLALAEILVAQLPADLPKDQVQADAVADGRIGGNEEVRQAEAELSFRVSAAGQIRFGFDSDIPAQGEVPRLERMATWLGQHPEAKVILRAHSDARGPEEYNRILAQRRAGAVRNGLIQLGVPESRIDVKVVGEGMPAPGADAGFADDRRVELLVTMQPLSEDAAVEGNTPE